MTHELLGQLTARKQSFQDSHLSAEQMGELIDMVQEKTITGESLSYAAKDLILNCTSNRYLREAVAPTYACQSITSVD